MLFRSFTLSKEEFTDEIVNEHEKSIQKFFNKLSQNKIACSSDFFINFLSISDRITFEHNKEEMTDRPNPANFKEIKHLEGKAVVEVTNEKEHAGDSIKMFTNNCYGHINKLKSLNKINGDTAEMMMNLSNQLRNQSEVYKEIGLDYAHINVFNLIYNSLAKLLMHLMDLGNL